ncbi:MAG: 30S ribosomal protein S16 [Firmicutes bacterium]|nr:30S ribosomal protein S16 [Bacillota bacterium]MBO2520288.1 30S ribosomal protein S16 [Bacillota bacterium]
MAVRIRLKRMGAKKRPFYRLVVADSRAARDGRVIDTLGYYDPLTDPATVKVDAERAKAWLGQGAQPSDTARKLLVRAGVLDGDGKAPSQGEAGEA